MYPNEAISTRRNTNGSLEVVVIRRDGETDNAFQRRIKRALRQKQAE